MVKKDLEKYFIKPLYSLLLGPNNVWDLAAYFQCDSKLVYPSRESTFEQSTFTRLFTYGMQPASWPKQTGGSVNNSFGKWNF